ncbi:MAG: VCBS repeat-containing protein [Vicinamibacterales bacterium]
MNLRDSNQLVVSVVNFAGGAPVRLRKHRSDAARPTRWWVPRWSGINGDAFPDIIVATTAGNATCGPAGTIATSLLVSRPSAPVQFDVSTLNLDLSAALPVDGAPIVVPIRFPCDLNLGVAINGAQFQGDGSGNFQFVGVPALDAGTTLVSEVAGDFDNDGSPDLIRLVHDADGSLIVQSYENQDVPQPERPVITKVKINKKGKVVVMGTGLTGDTRIIFNGVKLDAALKNGGKLVSATAPAPIASGTEVSVQVILPDGTVSDGYLYTRP